MPRSEYAPNRGYLKFLLKHYRLGHSASTTAKESLTRETCGQNFHNAKEWESSALEWLVSSQRTYYEPMRLTDMRWKYSRRYVLLLFCGPNPYLYRANFSNLSCPSIRPRSQSRSIAVIIRSSFGSISQCEPLRMAITSLSSECTIILGFIMIPLALYTHFHPLLGKWATRYALTSFIPPTIIRSHH